MIQNKDKKNPELKKLSNGKIDYKNKYSGVFSKKYFYLSIFLSVFTIYGTASAIFYSPGATLNPGCLPIDPDCDVLLTNSLLATTTVFGGQATGTYNNISIINLSTSSFSSGNISQWINDIGYMFASDASSSFLTFDYASSTFASTSFITGNYVPYSYASSTFPSFDYSSSTFYFASNPSGYITTSNLSSYITTATATSTFPSFDYSSSTFPSFTYASSTFPSFTYATSTYVNFGYASSTFVDHSYASSSFALAASGTQWTTSGADIYYTTGKVGIGTSTPNAVLNVSGTGGTTSPVVSIVSTGANPTFATNADDLLTVRGTGSVSNKWTGRITAGGDNFEFLMGQYNFSGTPYAWLGAHNATLSAWADLYINPDGTTEKTYIGSRGGFANGPALTVQNVNGSVGIGTTTPVAKLEVYGTAGNNAVADFASSTNASVLYVGANNRVGIGTRFPASTLEVNADNPSLKIRDTTNSVYDLSLNVFENAANSINFVGVGKTFLQFDFTNSVATFGEAFESGRIVLMGNTGLGTSSPSARLDIYGTSSAPTTDLFAVSSSSFDRLFTITSAGNVGIGTTSPSQLLTVGNNNQTTISSAGTINTNSITGLAGLTFTSNRVNIQGSTLTGNLIGLNLYNNGGIAWSSDSNHFGTKDIGLTRVSAGILGVGNGQAIGSATGTLVAGMIGIGTSTPVSKLDIYGVSTQPTTDIFSVSSSSFSRLFTVMANGNVGIGTSTPSDTLFVLGSSTYSGITVGGNIVPHISFKSSADSGNTWQLGTYNNLASTFSISRGQTNGAGNDKFSITSGGNVGIGSTTPASLLSVMASSTAQTSPFISFNSTTSPIFTVLTNGNVGIGTASPTSKLMVDGDVKPLTDNTRLLGGGNNRWFNLYVTNILSGNNVYPLNIGRGGSDMTIDTSGNFGIGTSTPSAKFNIVGTSSAPTTDIFAVSSSSFDRLFTITSAGNLGIGTSTPATALSVIGTSTTQGLAVTNLANAFLAVDGSGNVVATTTPAIGSFVTFNYSSSTFPSFTYASSTYVNFNYASSTFIDYIYASSTFPSFSYASSTFALIASGTQWTTSGADIYYTTGNVGVGQSTPATTLDVYGTFNININTAGGDAASGGNDIYTSGDYTVHVFTSGGTFTPVQGLDIEYLIVGGGGGGGGNVGGGGGGGAVATGTMTLSAQDYSVTVGDGGAGGPGSNQLGTNGATSTFNSVNAGGGGGGGWYASNGRSSATGGGGGGNNRSGGTGNNGGNGGDGVETTGVDINAGGGGGAGGAGTNGASGQGGNGGVGKSSDITGSSVAYGGGGGAGVYVAPNTVAGTGTDGGGNGGDDQDESGINGTANTGGGGGGNAGGGNGAGGDGGSGIVIIRYLTPAIVQASMFRTTSDGNVGIGTTTPTSRLDIYGLGGTADIFGVSSSSYERLFTITSNGNVGIGTSTPTANFSASGTIQFISLGSAGANLQTDSAGNVTIASDERLKNIKGFYERGLADIMKIDPIQYHWKKETGFDTVNTYTGFSAQNILTAIPEAVATSSNGFLSLADRPIVAALVNAVKQIGSFITKIEDGIAYLKNIVVENLAIGSQGNPSGITMYDEVTGNPYCVVITNGILRNQDGACSKINSSAAVLDAENNSAGQSRSDQVSNGNNNNQSQSSNVDISPVATTSESTTTPEQSTSSVQVDLSQQSTTTESALPYTENVSEVSTPVEQVIVSGAPGNEPNSNANDRANDKEVKNDKQTIIEIASTTQEEATTTPEASSSPDLQLGATVFGAEISQETLLAIVIFIQILTILGFGAYIYRNRKGIN